MPHRNGNGNRKRRRTEAETETETEKEIKVAAIDESSQTDMQVKMNETSALVAQMRQEFHEERIAAAQLITEGKLSEEKLKMEAAQDMQLLSH